MEAENSRSLDRLISLALAGALVPPLFPPSAQAAMGRVAAGASVRAGFSSGSAGLGGRGSQLRLGGPASALSRPGLLGGLPGIAAVAPLAPAADVAKAGHIVTAPVGVRNAFAAGEADASASSALSLSREDSARRGSPAAAGLRGMGRSLAPEFKAARGLDAAGAETASAVGGRIEAIILNSSQRSGAGDADFVPAGWPLPGRREYLANPASLYAQAYAEALAAASGAGAKAELEFMDATANVEPDPRSDQSWIFNFRARNPGRSGRVQEISVLFKGGISAGFLRRRAETRVWELTGRLAETRGVTAPSAQAFAEGVAQDPYPAYLSVVRGDPRFGSRGGASVRLAPAAEGGGFVYEFYDNRGGPSRVAAEAAPTE